MAYFPHAYQKMLVANSPTPFKLGTGTEATTTLLPGQVGIVDPKNHKLVDLAEPAVDLYGNGLRMIYLAQGSFYQSDKLGSSLHGGYKETVKSKGINPKYVSAFYLTKSAEAAQHVLMVRPAKDCETRECDTTYRLRVDVKGSPALRFLTHNLYQTLDAHSGCCGTNPVDPMVLLLQWKEAINASPILNQFVQAAVFNVASTATTSASPGTNITAISATFDMASTTAVAEGQRVVGARFPVGAVVTSKTAGKVTISFPDTGVTPDAASFNNEPVTFYSPVTTAFSAYTPDATPATNDCFLTLTGAYSATDFQDCSFSPMDHVEYQPIEIYASVVEQTDVPCDTSCFGKGGVITNPANAVISNGGVYVLAQAKQGKGFGETVVREYILDKRYRQEPWNQDPRLREVLGNTTLTTDISRTAKYWALHILHNVPRSSNPSGTMDSDQYLIKIVFPASDSADLSIGSFIDFLNAYFAAAGNPVACVDEFGVPV